MRLYHSILPFLIFLVFSCAENGENQDASNNVARSTEKYEIPKVLHNVYYDENDKLYVDLDGKRSYLQAHSTVLTSTNFENHIQGNAEGLVLNLNNSKFKGTLYYGFIPDNRPGSYPIYYKKPTKIEAGKALIKISELQGKLDMISWRAKGFGQLGYRIIDSDGLLWHENKIRFTYDGNRFVPDVTIIEDPILSRQTHNSIGISFVTNENTEVELLVAGKSYESNGKIHRIDVDELDPATEYEYTIKYGKYEMKSKLRTAPAPGSKSKFHFAFASDCRAGPGGGERNIFGVNAYIFKKLVALAAARNSAFFQFTGDMISGYSPSIPETHLQYTNWKQTLAMASHKMPFNVGMGNHESLISSFSDGSEHGLSIDRFPYNTSSSEKIFAENFYTFDSELISEDDSKYDPEKGVMNFPSYQGNVYKYEYDNIAVIVLNSNYWYSPSGKSLSKIGGNLHGYIMDNQLEWFRKAMSEYEADSNIDHVFITFHTPAFPNGGHVKDDMWYLGDNSYRPFIAGKAVDKGIIERRDEILDIFINQSKKGLAILAGDEHNYSRLKIDSDINIYPVNWDKEKIEISRTIWQITNGSAGAPYYALEETPWSPKVEIFSSKYAICLFHIEGSNVELEVVDPITFDEIERVKLR